MTEEIETTDEAQSEENSEEQEKESMYSFQITATRVYEVDISPQEAAQMELQIQDGGVEDVLEQAVIEEMRQSTKAEEKLKLADVEAEKVDE